MPAAQKDHSCKNEKNHNIFFEKIASKKKLDRSSKHNFKKRERCFVAQMLSTTNVVLCRD